MAKKPESTDEINIVAMRQGSATFFVVGTSPLVLNRLSEKAKRELLLPRGRKNTAERASTLKHDPRAEFADSVYRWSGSQLEEKKTLLSFPGGAFKSAIATGALDMPDVHRTVIGRLVSVSDYQIELYGRPMMWMTGVRSADQNKTPDIRTRAILPEWACVVRVTFAVPRLNHVMVATLLATAGITIGVGDGRQEKGKLSFGAFRIADADDDPDYLRIVKFGDKAVQQQAMEAQEPFDDETASLLAWFDAEKKRRGGDSEAPEKKRRGSAE